MPLPPRVKLEPVLATRRHPFELTHLPRKSGHIMMIRNVKPITLPRDLEVRPILRQLRIRVPHENQIFRARVGPDIRLNPDAATPSPGLAANVVHLANDFRKTPLRLNPRHANLAPRILSLLRPNRHR
jgi:hypothetical protein